MANTQQWLILRLDPGGKHIVEARLDIPTDAEQPDRNNYGFGSSDYSTEVGNFPDVYRGYRRDVWLGKYVPGTLPPLPVNPKAAWSERLEDMRTFAEFKALLMECPEILAVGGYMNATLRQAHDSIRPPNALTPPPDTGDSEDAEDAVVTSDSEDDD